MVGFLPNFNPVHPTFPNTLRCLIDVSLIPNGGAVCNGEKYNALPVNKDKFMATQKF